MKGCESSNQYLRIFLQSGDENCSILLLSNTVVERPDRLYEYIHINNPTISVKTYLLIDFANQNKLTKSHNTLLPISNC